MLRSRASAEGASAQVESPHNPERAQSPSGAQAPKARANSSVTVTTENRTLPPKRRERRRRKRRSSVTPSTREGAPSHHRASAEGASAQVGNPHNPEHARAPQWRKRRRRERRAPSPPQPRATPRAPQRPPQPTPRLQVEVVQRSENPDFRLRRPEEPFNQKGPLGATFGDDRVTSEALVSGGGTRRPQPYRSVPLRRRLRRHERVLALQ